jgi:hypothetical protein
MADTRGGVLVAPDQIVIAPLLATGVSAMQLFVNGSTVVREIIQATEDLLRG